MAGSDCVGLVVLLVMAGGVGCFSESNRSLGPNDDESGSSETGGSTGDPVADVGMGATTESSGETTEPTTAQDSSTGEVSLCGDGTLDDGELCDGGPGCTECVLDDYVCNPYNNAGCIEVQTCDRTRGATLDDQRTGCFQQGQAGYGDACTFDPLDPLLQCGNKLSCVGAAYHPACSAAECCTEFCDLTDPSTCPDPSTQCLTWKETGMPPGLDTLGLCIKL